MLLQDSDDLLFRKALPFMLWSSSEPERTSNWIKPVGQGHLFPLASVASWGYSPLLPPKMLKGRYCVGARAAVIDELRFVVGNATQMDKDTEAAMVLLCRRRLAPVS
jgi:hypothetical protein